MQFRFISHKQETAGQQIPSSRSSLFLHRESVLLVSGRLVPWNWRTPCLNPLEPESKMSRVSRRAQTPLRNQVSPRSSAGNVSISETDWLFKKPAFILGTELEHIFQPLCINSGCKTDLDNEYGTRCYMPFPGLAHKNLSCNLALSLSPYLPLTPSIPRTTLEAIY